MGSRILIADDESALLGVMAQYLRRVGYDVVACRSGKQAFAAFEADAASFDLFVADASLPDVARHELLVRMGEVNARIGFLVCSGYPFDVSALPPEIQGRAGFLQKPFTPTMLNEAVTKLLVGSR